MTPAGFPHSDTPGSTLGCQLPRAYRRLLRPSSALDAKASTMCPSQLVTHTTNPTPHHTATPHRRSHTAGTRLVMHTTKPQRTTTHPHHNQMRACNIQTSNHTPHHPTTSPPQDTVPKNSPQGQPAQGAQVRGYKMLASTIQISNNNPTPEPHTTPDVNTRAGTSRS
jgi:hypothetical protein